MIEIKMVGEKSAEVFLFGEIGWEVDSGQFARELSGIDAEKLTVRVDSPGGDAYQGIAIMNALRGHPGHVTAVIEGLAASAASFIAVGGADHVIIRPHAEVMVHDAMAFTGGNAQDMQKTIADLDRISDSIASVYAEKAGGEPEGWREVMRAETWYSAEEAVASGLADVVEDARAPVEARQRVGVFNLSRFKYPGRRSAPTPTNHAPLGQEGDTVSLIKNLAQELGMKESDLRNRILNESIEVVTNVEVTYPGDVKVVPTGKVKIAPVGEDMPEGLTFTLGDVPEGWSAEINDSSGELTVVAPAVAPGESATFAVTAQGTGAATEFSVVVTVKSAAEEDPAEEVSTPDSAPLPEVPANDQVVNVDKDTFAELKAMAKLGAKAHAESVARKQSDEVDQWIAEGRINASLRAKAVKAMSLDPEVARALYGSNPKNTIPRGEMGHSVDASLSEESSDDVPSIDELKKRAAGRANKKGNK